MNELSVSRDFKGSPSELWKAWTDPASLEKWWWPESFNTNYSVDLREGGAYKFITPELPNIGVLDLEGTYTSVQEPNSLEYSWRWGGEQEHESNVSVTFVAGQGGMTEITVHHQGLEDEEDVTNHIQGWNDCLDRLEKL